ncbi:MAG: hypothetical protein AAF449_06080 [Myxococcota bacterium]
MRARHQILALCILGIMGGACRQDASPPKKTPLIGGIQVNEPQLRRWIRTIDEAGLNTVATTVYAKQGDWDSANLWSDAKIPPVRREIAAAKQAGLRVVLVLRIALDHAFERNRFLWHGMIAPRTDDDIDRWFAAYTDFVLRWARVAEKEKVDVLGIGSELNRLTATRPVVGLPALEDWYLDSKKQEDFMRRVLAHDARITARHRAAMGGGAFKDNASFLKARSDIWRAWAKATTFQDHEDPRGALNARRRLLDRKWRMLISKVRTVFSGKLTYAANFDHYQEVQFWDALDIVGINAYFELRPNLHLDDLDARLVAGWRRVFDEIEGFRRDRRLAHPILFTELGYTRRRHSTVKPWAQNGFMLTDEELLIWEDQRPDIEERAAALRALRRVSTCERPDILTGVLYWKLSSWPDQRSVEPFVVVLDGEDPAQDILKSFLSSDCRSGANTSPAR